MTGNPITTAQARASLLHRYLVATYFVTLANTAGYLRNVGFSDIVTGLHALAVYLTYSLFYLVPAIAVTKLAHGICRTSRDKDGGVSDRRATRNGVVYVVAVLSTSATQIGLYADKAIFSIFGMHLNGFVWNTVFSAGGIDSMGSSTATVLTYVAILSAFPLLQVALLLVMLKLGARPRAPHTTVGRRAVFASIGFFALSTVAQAIAYGVSDIRSYSPVLATASVFPLYQPVTFRRLAHKLGFDVESRDNFHLSAPSMRLAYPSKPLDVAPPSHPLNIVWLTAESLRADMLDPRIMPKSWAFAGHAHRFTRHYSGGNGTRMGMFAMFYGLYGSYWFPFLQEHRSPILMDVLQQQGYQLFLFTSARFTYPEFDRTIFARVSKEDMLEDYAGPGWGRDRRNVDRILEAIRSRDPAKPFMSFMFFESPHAPYHFPPECAIQQPYLEDFNYATMDNQRDMPLVKNRYINSCYHLDTQLDRVLGFLHTENLLDSTIVIITGDHGEEFMEKGRWGHNSEFTEEQLRAPLVMWVPGTGSSVVNTMTSHLDLAPTLLGLLGVRNPAEEVSQGVNLLGGATREYAIVADWSRLGYVDDEFKATFPLNLGATFRNRVTDAKDAPLPDPSVFYEARRARLLEVMKEMRRFGR